MVSIKCITPKKLKDKRRDENGYKQFIEGEKGGLCTNYY